MQPDVPITAATRLEYTASNRPDAELAELLQLLLHERDIPCPLCAYNLRNLVGVRCPECGGELKLQVGLVEPRLGAYIALLSACCLGLGGSALFSIVAGFNAPNHWWHEWAGSILLTQLLIMAVLLPIILTRRARFRKTPATFQWFIGGGLWLIVVGLGLPILQAAALDLNCQ